MPKNKKETFTGARMSIVLTRLCKLKEDRSRIEGTFLDGSQITLLGQPTHPYPSHILQSFHYLRIELSVLLYLPLNTSLTFTVSLI